MHIHREQLTETGTKKQNTTIFKEQFKNYEQKHNVSQKSRKA